MSVARSPHAAGVSRPRWEVADVFRQYGGAYRSAHRLPRSHLKVMRAIEVCRTEYLGGHVERCDTCGFERHAYNSCRNRHCPKCQALAKAAWLEARKADLLDVDYFHVVFTLPHAVNPIGLRNKKTVFDLLFRAAADTLQTFAADPRNGLGGKLGFTAVLHTWDQQLRDHFHLHCLVPAGALAPDRSHWIHARNDFLFPVKALSKVFRGKFIALLNEAFTDGRLHFPGTVAPLGTPAGFGQLVSALWKKPWVVYAKRPFAGPSTVLDYLGRYTHRVAIANHRITRIHDGYVRIRHFGFLASRAKAKDLPRCRELLGMPPRTPTTSVRPTRQTLLERLGLDFTTCPHCRRGTMRLMAELAPLYHTRRQRYSPRCLHRPGT